MGGGGNVRVWCVFFGILVEVCVCAFVCGGVCVRACACVCVCVWWWCGGGHSLNPEANAPFILRLRVRCVVEGCAVRGDGVGCVCWVEK